MILNSLKFRWHCRTAALSHSLLSNKAINLHYGRHWVQGKLIKLEGLGYDIISFTSAKSNRFISRHFKYTPFSMCVMCRVFSIECWYMNRLFLKAYIAFAQAHTHRIDFFHSIKTSLILSIRSSVFISKCVEWHFIWYKILCLDNPAYFIRKIVRWMVNVTENLIDSIKAWTYQCHDLSAATVDTSQQHE